MFGESTSESPRMPSPWLALSPSPSPALAPSPSPPTRPLPIRASLSDEFSALSISPCSLDLDSPLHEREEQEREASARMPRLVPEVEEGNIEYKLKLIAPTPDRFARLVTQLKWRLLEGGGQAIYEIGVADSGQLVGLTAYELEESLSTLERMADDLGATVLISRAIEVPVLTGRIEGAGRVPPPFPTPSPSPPPRGAEATVVHREDTHTHTPPAIVARTGGRAAEKAKGANKRRAARKMMVKQRKREMLAGSQASKVRGGGRGKDGERRSKEEVDSTLAVVLNGLSVVETKDNNSRSADRKPLPDEAGVDSAPLPPPPRIPTSSDAAPSPTPSPSPSPSPSVDPSVDDSDESSSDTDDSSRWIVEALVLRKLDAEQGEGFLDFEGFGVE